MGGVMVRQRQCARQRDGSPRSAPGQVPQADEAAGDGGARIHPCAAAASAAAGVSGGRAVRRECDAVAAFPVGCLDVLQRCLVPGRRLCQEALPPILGLRRGGPAPSSFLLPAGPPPHAVAAELLRAAVLAVIDARERVPSPTAVITSPSRGCGRHKVQAAENPAHPSPHGVPSAGCGGGSSARRIIQQDWWCGCGRRGCTLRMVGCPASPASEARRRRRRNSWIGR